MTFLPNSLLPDPTLATAPDFREAMSRVAGAVNVITTDGPAGRAGLTATAVTSVSDAPPTLLACLNRHSRTLLSMQPNAYFAVNVLAGQQLAIAEAFTGKTGLDGAARFALGDWQTGMHGQPLLNGALASFECELQEAKPVASHVVLIGLIRAIRLGQGGAGLVYARRGYHAL